LQENCAVSIEPEEHVRTQEDFRPAVLRAEQGAFGNLWKAAGDGCDHAIVNRDDAL